MYSREQDIPEAASAPSHARSYAVSENQDEVGDPGPSQAKERPRGHVGHTDEELAEMRKYDLKRVKRIMANRSSAARSKVRKMRYTNELDSRIAALSNEQRGLQEEFYAVQANIATLSKENDFLCDEIRKLHDDVSKANTYSVELKEQAHLLRMMVLSGPLTTPRPSQLALQNFQAATSRDAALTLQAPTRTVAPSFADDALLSFSNSGPNLTVMNLNSNNTLGGAMSIPADLAVAPGITAPQSSPFIARQLWSNPLSSSSTSSAFSSHGQGRLPPSTDRRMTADDPFLLNMLHSIDLSSDQPMAARPSDISSRSALINSGSSWNPRPSLSQMLSTRSSFSSMPADLGAWSMLPVSPAASENPALLPLLTEQRKQFRRSAGDFPLGLPEPLQGLARYPRHFSEPPEHGLQDIHAHMARKPPQ